MKADVELAAKILEKGGIILYPTDTVWGIGCLATHEEAIYKVYQLKQREDSKSMLVLADSLEMLKHYIENIPVQALEIFNYYSKPVTIIYPRAKNLPENLLAEDGSIGIRLVKEPFCLALIKNVGKPIVSTSANISGENTPGIFAEISEKIKTNVDYVVKWRQDEMERKQPSAIIKFQENGDKIIIRE